MEWKWTLVGSPVCIFCLYWLTCRDGKQCNVCVTVFVSVHCKLVTCGFTLLRCLHMLSIHPCAPSPDTSRWSSAALVLLLLRFNSLNTEVQGTMDSAALQNTCCENKLHVAGGSIKTWRLAFLLNVFCRSNDTLLLSTQALYWSGFPSPCSSSSSSSFSLLQGPITLLFLVAQCVSPLDSCLSSAEHPPPPRSGLLVLPPGRTSDGTEYEASGGGIHCRLE